MPLYDCECSAGHRFERQIPLAKFKAPIVCDCGLMARRCISRPRFIAASINYEYACPITGKHITSKREHEENLKQHNCRVLEGGEREFNNRRNREAEESAEREIEKTVEREIATMPSEKQELLGKALEHGVNAVVQRQ